VHGNICSLFSLFATFQIGLVTLRVHCTRMSSALTSEIAFLNSVQTLRKYDKEQVKKGKQKNAIGDAGTNTPIDPPLI
jgi:hypothetical protein